MALAFVNFFIINDNDYSPSVLIMPFIVGLILGGLVQLLVSQKALLNTLNTQLNETNKALIFQQVETRNTIERMQRIQVSSLLAIGSIHDIRNILTPIIMGIDLISTSDDSDKQTLIDMTISANRCIELTNKILSTLQNSDFSPTPQQIETAIPHVWERVQTLLPGEINIQFSIQPQMLKIELDDLMQIIHNLALNAYKFLGSELKLIVKGKTIKDKYCLEFTDNGPGLPEHLIANNRSSEYPKRR
jgi:two-component system, NtrC family, sensor histidine kinase AtoS